MLTKNEKLYEFMIPAFHKKTLLFCSEHLLGVGLDPILENITCQSLTFACNHKVNTNPISARQQVAIKNRNVINTVGSVKTQISSYKWFPYQLMAYIRTQDKIVRVMCDILSTSTSLLTHDSR